MVMKYSPPDVGGASLDSQIERPVLEKLQQMRIKSSSSRSLCISRTSAIGQQASILRESADNTSKIIDPSHCVDRRLKNSSMVSAPDGCEAGRVIQRPIVGVPNSHFS